MKPTEELAIRVELLVQDFERHFARLRIAVDHFCVIHGAARAVAQRAGDLVPRVDHTASGSPAPGDTGAAQWLTSASLAVFAADEFPEDVRQVRPKHTTGYAGTTWTTRTLDRSADLGRSAYCEAAMLAHGRLAMPAPSRESDQMGRRPAKPVHHDAGCCDDSGCCKSGKSIQ